MASKYQLFAQYPTLASVLSLLKSAQYEALPEVQELLNIYFKINNEASTGERKFPLIVMEGLDGCGKSHTSRLVAQKLHATLKSTPPSSVLSLREKFDTHEPLLKRAFYSLGNYIAAQDIKQVLCKQPVVMDRFWHSTSAYAMATEIVNDKHLTLPKEGDDIFSWPKDLVKPDLVIFLTVSESIRLQRLSRRKTFTAEEDELKKNAKFREILNSIYRRMKDPELLVVDNSEKSVQESSDDLVKIIQELPSWKNS